MFHWLFGLQKNCQLKKKNKPFILQIDIETKGKSKAIGAGEK